jgi:hypothetical protein
MHVLRVVRVLIPVAIAIVLVAAGSSLLSARPDLTSAQHDVQTSWSQVAPALDARYTKLKTVNTAIRTVPGPVATLVRDVGGALDRWNDARAHASVAGQVSAANAVEGLARRLVATATVSPRLRGNDAVLGAFSDFLHDPARSRAAAFNEAVVRYEHERHGPLRALVASILGDDAVPALDTTEMPESTAS